MTVFSPRPLQSDFWGDFVVKLPPPLPPEESKCKNAQFLQCILKDGDVYFKKSHSILNWEEFFHNEKYRGFPQHAATTILRHWATMG